MQTECIVIDKHIDRLGFTCWATSEAGESRRHHLPCHTATACGSGTAPPTRCTARITRAVSAYPYPLPPLGAGSITTPVKGHR